jgi:hypothetical protein
MVPLSDGIADLHISPFVSEPEERSELGVMQIADCVSSFRVSADR